MKPKNRGATALVQLAFCVRAQDAQRLKRAAAESGEPMSVYLRRHLQELESDSCAHCNETGADAAALEAQIDAARRCTLSSHRLLSPRGLAGLQD